MKLAVAGEPLERGDLAALRPERGNKATVNGLAIEPDRARTAITGITPFFHPKPAKAPRMCANIGRDEVPLRMTCR